MKIVIKPLPRNRWHDKKGKESFTRPIRLNALADPDTMKYATGLDYNEKIYDDPFDSNAPKITEAEYYGKLLRRDLDNSFIPNRPHPVWDDITMSVKLEDNTIFLNSDNPLEYIKIKICKASKFVANSLKDYEEGFFPYATHYIYDEQEESEKEATKTELRTQATLKCAELSREKKLQIVLIVAGKNLYNKSDKFLAVELEKTINNNAQEVLNILNLDKDYISTLSLVKRALDALVLKQSGHKIMYYESVIGIDEEDAAKYLMKEENQDLKIRIQTLTTN